MAGRGDPFGKDEIKKVARPDTGAQVDAGPRVGIAGQAGGWKKAEDRSTGDPKEERGQVLVAAISPGAGLVAGNSWQNSTSLL